MQERAIPAYSLFGQAAGLLEPRFCHVERIGDRWKLHGGHVEEHSHPHLHQLTLWIAGTGHYVADEQTSGIMPGTCCWMPAGVVHGFRVEAGSEAIVLSMSDDFAREQLAGLSSLAPFQQRFILTFADPEREWLLALFSRMELEYASSLPGQVECLGALGRLALAELLRRREHDRLEPTPRGGESSLLVRFMSLVEARLGQRGGVAELARDLGTTPYLLNRACKGGLGMKASEVVRARHAQEAKRLLLFTALGIGEIGQLMGHPDPAHFARAFRMVTGQTPRAWRAQRMGAEASSAPDGGQ